MGLLLIEPETQGFRMAKGAPSRISWNHTEVAVFVDYLCSAQHHYLLLLAFQGVGNVSQNPFPHMVLG